MARRRADLAEAALRVMRRDGAWTVTTRAVAAEAGVPHGSVHYAFGGKEGLLQAVISADTESAAGIFASVAAEGGTPEHVLARAFTAYTDRVVADPDTELVLQELTLMGVRDAALGELVGRWTAEYRTSLARLLDELAEQTGGAWQSPVPIIVEQLLGMLFGMTIAWLGDRDEALLRGALADAARATAARLR